VTPLATARYALLLCLALTRPTFAASNNQEQLENLRSRIAEIQRNMERTNTYKSQAQDALREAERAISNSNRRIAELSAQRQEANQTLSQLRGRQQKLGNTLQAQQQLLSQQLYFQYTAGNPGYLQQLLSGEDFNQLARNLQYYQYLARDRATWLTDLRTNLGTLRITSQTVKQQGEKLAVLAREETAQRNKLKQDKQLRQHMLKKYSRQLRQQRREVSRLQRDEARLTELIAQLSKLIDQPSDNLPEMRTDGPLFAQLKGKLPLPVKGKIINRYGTPRPDSPVLWKGLFIKSVAGQTVKAIAPGRVVFADWLRGFGNILIIDHGMNYMSLYGNNETLLKQVGDSVASNDLIAEVGNSGGNEQSGLYFELRHEGVPFDPAQWLASKLN
jgi:septal ring factor EnvC (AmiA/AmiB activator)